MTDVLILCYHAVSRDWDTSLAVAPGQLDRQVRRLLSQGFVPATFSRAVTDPPAPRTMALTFDDAFRSVLTEALPVLRAAGVPATVFVPTAFADGAQELRWPGIDVWSDGPHARELEPMSWDDLARLAEEDWEIGSHTVSHPRLTRLTSEALTAELVESRAACERHLGGRCRSLAYPYGDVDARVEVAASLAGYDAAAALGIGSARPRPLAWPRTGIFRKDTPSRFALKTSVAVRAVRRPTHLLGPTDGP